MSSSAPRPGGGGAPSSSSAQAPESKRGEVNELRAALRAVNAERGFDAATARRKREVIRKCIAYMTLGIDVSRLFPDMVMACNSRASSAPAAGGSYAQVASQDLVIKKMVYLYLTNYAQVRAGRARRSRAAASGLSAARRGAARRGAARRDARATPTLTTQYWRCARSPLTRAAAAAAAAAARSPPRSPTRS